MTVEFTPSARELADLEMLLDGGYAPLRGFSLSGAARLRVPDGVGTGAAVVLTDQEGAPLASLSVESVRDGYAAGPVTALAPAEFGPFRRLRRTAASVRDELAGAPVVGYVTAEPPTTGELADLGAARLLVLLAVGETGSDWPVETLIKAWLAADLPADSLIVPIALSQVDDASLRATVAGNYGATQLHPTASDPRLAERLDRGEDVVTPAVAAVLRHARPPRTQRGVVVFFTGLSGSGKSTVARGVADALAETTDRTVTLLDGDVVRRLLSAGLTFSRADRDRNIARIGFVAAEVARHGGIALCAPIAPYAAARAEVRSRVRRVGDFVLVYVATPLEVCEARDRKGLYAKARAGLLPEFTGISDPYEKPEDADLVLDTTETSTLDSVRTVIDFLTAQGYLADPNPTDP